MDKKEINKEMVIVMPVYNDWDSVKVLIKNIDDNIKNSSFQFSLLLVNDGSTFPVPDNLVDFSLHSIKKIDLLHLRRNLGHQRAIAIALTHIFKSYPCKAVIVMDADGEDRPEDILPLVNLCSEYDFKKIIFAERARRIEGLIFIFFYRCYQILHIVLTGYPIRVGNFSIIPFNYLSPLIVSSELWNHYAASVFKLKIPYAMRPTARAKRISGRSKMNFVSLVIHGLSAISVYSEIVGTRVLFAAFGINVFLFIMLFAIFSFRLFSDIAVPGWTTYSSGILIIIFLQILATTISFLFFVLNSRNFESFLPIRDYAFFIQEIKHIFSSHT